MNFPGAKIVLVGRPNVGKSSLFNRLIGKRQAIVDDIPGVTRDRQYGVTDWDGATFTVIDTGGLIPAAASEDLAKSVEKQVEVALGEADAIVFVVDGRQGCMPVDKEIAKALRKLSIPIFLAINKIDTSAQEDLAHEFLKLGFASSTPISTESSRGISALLDALFPILESKSHFDIPPSDVKVAILGQPNVGKSTLLNAILGEERAVVHPQAGTTLDPLNVSIERGSRIFEFIDTAGIRRKSHTQEKLEKISVLKSLDSIGRANVVLVVVDASQGIFAQDAKILSYAEEKGRATILVLNKWDQVKPEVRLEDFKTKMEEDLKRQVYIPMLAISAKTKRGLPKLFQKMDEVYENYQRRVSTGELNRVLQKAFQVHPHPTSSGQNIRFLYATQSSSAPPSFVIFSNRPKLVQTSYLRYLEKALRKEFRWEGVPLKLRVRGKKKEEKK